MALLARVEWVLAVRPSVGDTREGAGHPGTVTRPLERARVDAAPGAVAIGECVNKVFGVQPAVQHAAQRVATLLIRDHAEAHHVNGLEGPALVSADIRSLLEQAQVALDVLGDP